MGADTLAELTRAFPADAAHFDLNAVLPIGWVPGALHLKLALASTERAFGQFYSLGKMKLTLTGGLLDAQLTEFPHPTAIFGNVLGAGMVAFLRAGHVDAKLTTVLVGPSSISYQVKLTLPAADGKAGA